MNEGLPPLEANAMCLGDADDDGIGIYLPENDDDIFAMLPPGFATVGAMGTEPASLNEALQGPYAKEWQAALDYEIGQLKKLGTRVIEGLPKKAPVIPCTEVLKKKCGPTSIIKSYRVQIVAGRH